MALIKCENCGKLISEKAVKCPQCGLNFKQEKIKKKVDFINLFSTKKVILLFGSFIILICALFALNHFIFGQSLDKVKSSVVKIEVYDENNKLFATGSGFCVFDSDYIATNFHVIEGSYKIKIVTDENKKYDVTDILIFDSSNDLALLKFNGKLTPLKLGKEKNIKTGSKVIAIGSPLGELNTVSEGIISNSKNDKGIQISAPISHGSSGGALFDSKYRLIGITYSGYDEAQNLNYAISINYLKQMYKSYKNNNYYKITSNNYSKCISEPSGFDGCDGVSKKYFSVESLKIMYKITSLDSVYESLIQNNNRFNFIYNSLTYDDKKRVIENYRVLLENEFCYYSCQISKNISNWSVPEFFINLNVLSVPEFALVFADIENYSSDIEKFNRVEEYGISAAEKTLILYLIGNKNWNNITRTNKGDVFDFFDNKGFATNDLGAILSLLGYDVVYNNDDTLTAYWY